MITFGFSVTLALGSQYMWKDSLNYHFKKWACLELGETHPKVKRAKKDKEDPAPTISAVDNCEMCQNLLWAGKPAFG